MYYCFECTDLSDPPQSCNSGLPSAFVDLSVAGDMGWGDGLRSNEGWLKGEGRGKVWEMKSVHGQHDCERLKISGVLFTSFEV